MTRPEENKPHNIKSAAIGGIIFAITACGLYLYYTPKETHKITEETSGIQRNILEGFIKKMADVTIKFQERELAFYRKEIDSTLSILGEHLGENMRLRYTKTIAPFIERAEQSLKKANSLVSHADNHDELLAEIDSNMQALGNECSKLRKIVFIITHGERNEA